MANKPINVVCRAIPSLVLRTSSAASCNTSMRNVSSTSNSATTSSSSGSSDGAAPVVGTPNDETPIGHDERASPPQPNERLQRHSTPLPAVISTETRPPHNTPATSQEKTGYVDQLWDAYADASGVTEIGKLKSAVASASSSFDRTTDEVQRRRLCLERDTVKHERLSKLHHDMLQRRNEWDETDVASFAQLTADEVKARRDMNEARDALQEAEVDMGLRQVEYMDAMRKRYHEEQIWQDKWRVLGTYGTWALIALNSAVFLCSQYFHLKREEARLAKIEKLVQSDGRYLQRAGTSDETLRLEGRMDSELTSHEETIDADENAQARRSIDSTEQRNEDVDENNQESVKATSEEMESLGGTVKIQSDASVHEAQIREGATVPTAFKLSPLPSDIASNFHFPSALVGAMTATLSLVAILSLTRK